MHSFSVALFFLSLVLSFTVAAPLQPNNLIPNKRSFENARLTWYDITTGSTACGGTYSNSDYVVAVSADQFGSGSVCGREIRITANGITQNARIVDECQSCGYADLDLTKGLFSAFANPDDGVLTGSWDYA